MHISVASLRGSPTPLHGCTPIRLNRHSLILTSLLLPSIFTAPHQDPRGPLSLHQHLSFYPSFDISAPSVIWEVPLSAEVLQWHKWGNPQIPAVPYVYNSQRCRIFSDSVKPCQQIFHEKDRHFFIFQNGALFFWLWFSVFFIHLFLVLFVCVVKVTKTNSPHYQLRKP